VKVWEATVAVLKRTGNPAVMWGDEGLLHLIADELGWEHDAWRTSDRVLAALRKTPGDLISRRVANGRGRKVSIFHLSSTSDKETDQ